MKQQTVVAAAAVISAAKRKRRMALSSMVVEQNKQNLLLLPPEVLLDILSRLPAVSILRCECVCKTLHSLLFLNKHNPQFARAHLHHQQQLLDGSASDNYNFISLHYINFKEDGDDNEEDMKKTPTFQFLEYVGDDDDDDEYISYKVRASEFPVARVNPFRPRYYETIGSCNGLVCLVQFQADPTLICNPVTRECFYLPRDAAVDYEERGNEVTSAFGYHPGTDEYKVVRISEPVVPPFGKYIPALVQVYTIGNGRDGGRWRNKGQLDLKLGDDPAVLLDGVLYWSSRMCRHIVSFDLADEKFVVVPGPPDISSCIHIHQLTVLRGCLFIILLTKADRKLHFWVMKKDKKTWFEIEELAISWKDEIGPLACPVKANGEVLFWYLSFKFLASWDPKTEKAKIPAPREHLAPGTWSGAVPHIQSFISLKALGEGNAKIIGDGGSTS